MRIRSQSDEQLVGLARAGDERAFEAIVLRYRRPLLRHAQRILPDAAAEDAVQQAFLSAWSALLRGDEVRELGAWLHRIQHNVALNGLRAQRGEHAELTEAVTGGVTPEDALERRMALRTTLADVAALPERQREAVVRIAVQGRSQEEVARALGLSHGAVGALVMRGRRTLRAAADALTPPWVVDWFARFGDAPVAKVVAVVVVAGAATGPIVVHSDRAAPRAVAEAPRAERAGGAARDDGGGGRTPLPVVPRVEAPAPPVAPPADDRSGSDRRDDSSGPGSGGDSSGPGSGGADDPDSSGPGGTESDGGDTSGPGAGDDSSGSSGTGSGDESSGSGSGDDSSGSGSGDDSSGSGSSVSRSSGSESNGS